MKSWLSRRGAVAGLAGLALTCALGCEGKKKDPPPPPLAPQQGLSIDDVHQDHRAILVLGGERESALRVTVSTDPLTCEQLKRAYPERPPAAGARLDFSLAQPLSPDGSRAPWRVRSTVLSDAEGTRGLTTRGAEVAEVRRSAGQLTLVGLELASQDGAKMVTWTGDLRAQDCGHAKRKESDRPQAELALTVAGERLEIHGASLLPMADKTFLRLTRAPHACDSVFTDGYDFFLDLALAGDPPEVQFGALQGDLFPDDPSGSKGKDGFVVKVVEPSDAAGSDAGADGSSVEVELEGTLDLGGFKTKLAGKVAAERCVQL
jgi:hypothetical protein